MGYMGKLEGMKGYGGLLVGGYRIGYSLYDNK
jgi:hypothetical protein